MPARPLDVFCRLLLTLAATTCATTGAATTSWMIILLFLLPTTHKLSHPHSHPVVMMDIYIYIYIYMYIYVCVPRISVVSRRLTVLFIYLLNYNTPHPPTSPLNYPPPPPPPPAPSEPMLPSPWMISSVYKMVACPCTSVLISHEAVNGWFQEGSSSLSCWQELNPCCSFYCSIHSFIHSHPIISGDLFLGSR